MRSKAPLALMEQLIMVLVFALAAALCLKAFSSADLRSRQQELRDRAITEGQSMAELIKAKQGDLAGAAAVYGGQLTGDSWVCLFDGDWNQSEDISAARCRLEVVRQEAEAGLGMAQVSGYCPEDGTTLFVFSIAWQEEVSGLA